jgi:transposase
VVTDISHEGLRQLLREENVRFQAVRTWKRSTDPDFLAKRDRIVELYEMAEAGEAVVVCLDEFGPLNLQPQPGGKGWAPRAKPKRIRATYKRPHGVRHLIAAYDVGADRLYGHITKRKTRIEFLEFCRYIRSLHPPGTRLHFILDNFSPHHGREMRDWAAANNVELAYTPHYASWLNRIEAQFRALRYFTLAGTDHPDHATQARLIRRYIHWRNRNTDNPRLKRLINTANVARHSTRCRVRSHRTQANPHRRLSRPAFASATPTTSRRGATYIAAPLATAAARWVASFSLRA